MSEGVLQAFVARVLKVPAQPDPPAGRADSLQVFNAAPGFFRYRIIGWLLKQIGTVMGLIVGLLFLDRIMRGEAAAFQALIATIEVGGIVFFFIQLPFTFLMVKLDYRYRWYMVTDSSLRIREGLLRVREQTMTFANIQNLSICQGPLQRLFGITDLKVRTAGGGGEQHGKGNHEASESANMHLGFFRGVDKAEEIRDLIMDRMRGLKDSGLGDPDDVPVRTDDHTLLDAARDLRAECRQLRSTFLTYG